MLTILGNLKINSSDKLQHLKDSYMSFNNISDDWLINIRGQCRDEAIDYLKKQLGPKIIVFDLLNDANGWINNALEMIPKAKHNYILIWNEDHLNLAPQAIYENITDEMRIDRSEYLPISWWHFGRFRKHFNRLTLHHHKNTDSKLLTKTDWISIKNAGHSYYLISLLGIFEKKFLIAMMKKDRNKWPHTFSRPIFSFSALLNKVGLDINPQNLFQLINKVFGYKLSRYTHEAPFELEKDPSRIDMLPLRLSLPKRELFVSIDDDQSTAGYSLISRNQYKYISPVRNPGK